MRRPNFWGGSEIESLLVLVAYLVRILTLAIVARAILSWFPQVDPRNTLVVLLYRLTEPILAPLRQVLPRLGMFDITPMVAILLLVFIERALRGL